MFDFGIGYTELVVIGIVAVIVIGPKDLPKVLSAIGKTVAKMRGLAREFQGHMDSAIRDAGLDEVKKDLQSIRNLNPMEQVKKSVTAEVKKQDSDFKKYFGETPAPSDDTKPAST